MRAELIPASSRRWTQILDVTRHDFYHLPAYAEMSAASDGGAAVAAVVDDAAGTVLLPLVLRPTPGGRRDATSPYGYPGPLTTAEVGPEFLSAALWAVVGLLRDEGLVSLFVRLHPILNPTPPVATESIDVVRGGDTVSIDLTLPLDELWRLTRGNHKVQINRARRNGRDAVLDEGWTRYREFKQLYRATMERVAATPYYFFDDRYFDALRDALGERLGLWVVDVNGRLATAALFVETCGIVQYHLSGTDPAFAREGLMKLVVDAVRTWARARGDTDLHLGGGVGSAADSLLQFKLGFSRRRCAFHTVRVVIDEAEYDRLVALSRSGTAKSDGSPPASAGGDDGFFPAYRASRDSAWRG